MKTGRNSSCPCGSGRKFKHCCGQTSQPTGYAFVPAHIAARIDKEIVRREAYETEYGKVKEIISLEFQNQRMVVVDNGIYFSPKWKTFPDFLYDYLKIALGTDWWKAECAKAEDDQHQIIHWARYFYNYQKQYRADGDKGIISIIPDGTTAAYLALAYDLYVLRHHRKLQEHVLRRLKIRDQFQGARYELYVVAALIRAEFEIRFEDETDSTSKHPELLALHNATGLTIAVEAKSRHRPGVLGRPGQVEDPSEIKLGVHRLLNAAAKKTCTHPLVVFVDLNLPLERIPAMPDNWIDELRQEIHNVVVDAQGVWQFALAVLTNYRHRFEDVSRPGPTWVAYIVEPKPSGAFALDPVIADDIERAVGQFCAIPNEFPANFGNSAGLSS